MTISMVIMMTFMVFMIIIVIIMIMIPGRFTGSRFTCGYFCACPGFTILAIDTVLKKSFKLFLKILSI